MRLIRKEPRLGSGEEGRRAVGRREGGKWGGGEISDALRMPCPHPLCHPAAC